MLVLQELLLEAFPDALLMLFRSENKGKLILEVAEA